MIVDTFANLERDFALDQHFHIPSWMQENVIRGDAYYLLADGPLHLARDLKLDWGMLGELADGDSCDVHGLIVMGDLVIDGGLLNTDYDSGPLLLVRGNLVAHNLLAGGADIVVERDASIRDLVYGNYNHGSLDINGHLYAGAVVMFDHMFSAGAIHAARRIDDDAEIERDPEGDWEDDVLRAVNACLAAPVDYLDTLRRQLGEGATPIKDELRNRRALAPALFPRTADEVLRFVEERDLIHSKMIPPPLRADRDFMLRLTRRHRDGFRCVGNGWHLDAEFLDAALDAGSDTAAGYVRHVADPAARARLTARIGEVGSDL